MAIREAEAVARRATLQEAYAWCARYAAAHQENFTVISWVLPRGLRPHFASLYSFCRWTDDLGDEADGDRLALLDDFERDLLRCYEGIRTSQLFQALGHTIDRFHIPPEPFQKLIEANRMDQRITSFATYADLLEYCRHSATPVGRMVLYVLGYRDEERQRLSDATCTGLQLANFWEDVKIDRGKGRCYIPEEDLERFGVAPDVLAGDTATPAFRRLLHFEVERARALFAQGKGLERIVDRRSRADVRLFRLGGEAILDVISARHYDVLSSRPTIPKQKKARMALSAGLRMKLGF